MNTWRRLVLLAAAAAAFASPATAQVRGWPSEKPPKPLPQRPSTFPAYEVRTLGNGLTVVVVAQHEQPFVSAQMLVKAGAAYDPAGKAGLANLVAVLLDQGTTTRSAGEIAASIDGIGGELTVLSGTDVTFAQVTVMTDSFDAGLDMLSDVVRRPAFEAEEFERQLQQLRSGLHVSYADPAYLADLVFGRLVFGTHPYGQPGEGTPESIAAITRPDLVAFHRTYYVPNNAILAIVGDVTSASAFEAAARVFDGWARQDVALPVLPDPPEPAKRVVIVDRPGTVQSVIRIGQLGVARSDADFLPVDLGVRILGGEGANRLQRELRTARGLTYGAAADLDAYRLSGVIRAATDTRSAATAAVLRVSLDEFSKIVRETVSEHELDEAKAYLTGSYPLGLETPGSISTRILNLLFHGLPLKELETYRERVSAVTPDKIQRAMRAYVRPDRLSIVVVGDAAAFVPLLRGVGIRDPEIVPVGALDVSEPTLVRARPPAAAGAAVAPPVARREEVETMRAVVTRAVDAAGGIDVLRQIATIRAVGQTILVTPAGQVQAQTKTLVAYPDRFRVDAVTASGPLVQVFDAGHAWMWDKNGARDAPEPMRREFALSVRRDWVALLLAAYDGRLRGRRLDNETAEGGRSLDVVELWDADLPAVKLAVDSATARLERLTYDAPGPTGSATVTETFSDFRFVGQVLYPFVAVTRREGAPLAERRLTDVKINTGLAPDAFEKPK